MGNTQSAPTPREQYRLSKPKTNASSSNLLALAHMQTELDTFLMPPKTSNLEETEVVVTSPSGERRSRPDARPKLRAHLFGSNVGSARTELSEGDCERHCGLGELVSGVRDRLSRSGSPNSQPSSTRGSSTNLTNSLGASRLTLPDSTAPESEETRRLHQDIRAKASTDELAAFSHISSPVDEVAPNNAVLSPIRRRSLLTPGIATRVPDDILRKPPPRNKLQSQLDRAYYYNPYLSDSSPLARLAVLDLADHGRISPVARTATPTFHDYGHLGGLKLGTLRITNGAASPAPSDTTVHLVDGQSLAHVGQVVDYPTFHGRCKTEMEEDGPVPRYSYWQSRQFLPTMGYPFSDEKRAVRPGRVMNTANDVDCSTLPQRTHWNDEISKVNVLLPDGMPTEAIPPASSTTQQSMSLYRTSNECTDPALSIAQEYITELSDSPFSYQEAQVQGSPKLLSTTKTNEFDDNLFEDEGFLFSAQALSPKTEKWCLAVDDLETGRAQGGSREDALRILDGRTLSTLEPSICANSSPGSFPEHAGTHSPTPSEKALSKADSGYSSNASLRSLKNEQGLETASGLETTDRAKILSVEAYLCPPKRTPPPPPPSSRETNSAPTVRSIAYSRTSSAGEPLTLGALDVVKRLDTHRPSSLGTPASPATSPQQEIASSPIAVTQRRLKKGRPLSQPLPARYITVQGYRELSQSHIPPVPADVAAKLAQRHRAFPLLEHTFPSLQHTSLRDESTNMAPVSIPIRFPSPTKALDEETFPMKPQSPSASAKSPSNHEHSSHTHRSSMNWTKSKRRRSRERASLEDEYPETMADFSTLTDILGGSPYDIARSTLGVAPRLSDSQTRTRSHQPTNDISILKATGMDEEEAARFARSRSKTRSQGQLRSRTPSNSGFNDRGGIPGKSLRPNSMIIDAPPVPALPSLEQCQIEEQAPEKPTSERPASVPLGQPPMIVVSEVPDVTEWNNLRPTVSTDDKSWEEHRLTWLQRRRSAAEGLLACGQPCQVIETTRRVDERETAASAQSSAPANQVKVASYEASNSSLQRSTRFQQTSSMAVPSMKESRGVAPPAKPSFEYIAGRYTGGLSYGYEPGYGLGGSAGTRNTTTGASRKSVDVSRGFGIDLSDVPIFIAKTVDC